MTRFSLSRAAKKPLMASVTSPSSIRRSAAGSGRHCSSSPLSSTTVAERFCAVSRSTCPKAAKRQSRAR